MSTKQSERIEFKAEIKQVLDILIHSLYTEKEIFLRELISNASDALHRFKLESLKQAEVFSPGLELGIWLEGKPQTRSLIIRDSGLGMTEEEMVAYLGTIAHSGAKTFIETIKELNQGKAGSAAEVIGQFGVGFYSLFMVADEVTVTSRSFRPDAEAAFWHSDGQGSYEVGPAEKAERGTTIEIKLKEDAQEFADNSRLRNIVKTHSDFVAFPIYLPAEKEDEAAEDKPKWTQVNEQTALWRESSRELKEETYQKFYQQLTFDFDKPLRTIHFTADMPIQFYALLYLPSRKDYRMFRQDEYGLKLYARKVLIQENFKELLPPYLRFLEGVVDSEDLPLNVSRETVQATPVVQKIKKALTGRVASELGKMAQEEPESYRRFYQEFGQFLKEGIATDHEARERFVDLLRFSSSNSENADDWLSLAQYVDRMKPEQQEIYYLLGDDYAVLSRSSHLEYFKKHQLEVLYLSDPMDSFMLMGLSDYQGKALKNIDDADLNLSEEAQEEDSSLTTDEFAALLAKFKEVLGDTVADVRQSKVLTDSAARLANPAGGMASSMQRMQRLMGQELAAPKKLLELNPHNELIKNLSARLAANSDDALLPALIRQIYDNELLMEGLHPNPAEMIPRIQELMAELSKKA